MQSQVCLLKIIHYLHHSMPGTEVRLERRPVGPHKQGRCYKEKPCPKLRFKEVAPSSSLLRYQDFLDSGFLGADPKAKTDLKQFFSKGRTTSGQHRGSPVREGSPDKQFTVPDS